MIGLISLGTSHINRTLVEKFRLDQGCKQMQLLLIPSDEPNSLFFS